MHFPDLVRYNSLRELADVVIDLNGIDYKNCGIDLFPAGSTSVPTSQPLVNPVRIFIKTDLLEQALPFLSSLENPFHLLTGSSDLPGCPAPEIAVWLKSETKIQSWVGTNLEEHLPWMLCIPIGLEERGRVGRSPEDLFSFTPITGAKNIVFYLPHLSLTHASRQTILEKLLLIKDPRIFVETRRLQFQHYLNQLANAKFTICPQGNGYDTLRAYEAVVCGSTPVVFKTPIWRMHQRLGFLIVDDPLEILEIPEFPFFSVQDSSFLRMGVFREEIFKHQLRQCRF
ncbi:MAG: hypothetical protein VKL39_22280 [Leptolyngbyaceae bacterium]|nr:hypothetical protein [Leptolyngbyaceae bacterium]